jgi:hypothetical protein
MFPEWRMRWGLVALLCGGNSNYMGLTPKNIVGKIKSGFYKTLGN